MTRLRPHRVALALVLAFSALLECYRLGQNGWANTYYSAAVRSMLGSLHNFFFVSSDPGGLVTVDKPPIGLWLQTVSAAIFGFHPLSLLLPANPLHTTQTPPATILFSAACHSPKHPSSNPSGFRHLPHTHSRGRGLPLAGRSRYPERRIGCRAVVRVVNTL